VAAIKDSINALKSQAQSLDRVSENKFSNSENLFSPLHAAIAVHGKPCVPTHHHRQLLLGNKIEVVVQLVGCLDLYRM